MSKKKPPEDKPAAPFNNPFGSLSLGPLPSGPPPAVAAASQPKGPACAVVRMERKGRGGKEVTVVEQLKLSLVQRQTWLKELKNSLGCGGVLEGDDLVLQGDHRDRVKELLIAKGVKRVIVG
ncbi:MAG: translation initiation factor [Myxococcaceae bacterium]